MRVSIINVKLSKGVLLGPNEEFCLKKEKKSMAQCGLILGLSKPFSLQSQYMASTICQHLFNEKHTSKTSHSSQNLGVNIFKLKPYAKQCRFAGADVIFGSFSLTDS